MPSHPADPTLPSGPTGTVVIVFTDIQESTALWEQVPDAMRVALEQHHTLLRHYIAEHDGYEVKTEGAAATDRGGHRLLTSHQWISGAGPLEADRTRKAQK